MNAATACAAVVDHTVTRDREDRIRAVLDAIDPVMGSGRVTLEKVKVIRCGRAAVEP